MADSEPNLSDDELISAYCDGELRGAELARAEELLATRPECRQLLEEFRALRSRLQEVPPRTLSDNFAERVLRRAERDILVPIGAADSSPPQAAAVSPRRWRWPQGRRPWIYAAAALAAALLVMLMESKEAPREHLAKSTSHDSFPPDMGISAPPANGPAPAGAAAAAREESERVVSKDAAAGKAVMREQAPSAGPQGVEAAAPASASPAKLAHSQPAPDDLAVKRAIDEWGWPTISQQLAEQAAAVEKQQAGQPLDPDVLIVECDVAPQGRHADPMVASLRGNSILVEPVAPQADRRLAKAPADLQPAASNALPPVATNAAPAENVSRTEPVELFFVVATPRQIEATLEDLANRPGVSLNYVTRNRSRSAGGQNAGALPPRSQSSLPTGPQGRAQRLEITDKMRRLIESAPAGGQNRAATDTGPDADRAARGAMQEKPAGKQTLKAEAEKPAAQAVSPPRSAEEVPLQRALIIVRNRAAAK